jgi:hypothetical protein
VLVFHEKEVNEFLRMAYFGSVFGRGVYINALNYILEELYLMNANFDVFEYWRFMDFLGICWCIYFLLL